MWWSSCEGSFFTKPTNCSRDLGSHICSFFFFIFLLNHINRVWWEVNMRRTFEKILKKQISVQLPINNSYECFFLIIRNISLDSQTHVCGYSISIMCDIEVLAIEMNIYVKHMDTDKRGNFIHILLVVKMKIVNFKTNILEKKLIIKFIY